MARRTYREITIFNLSFLDVLCSALGAIIIILVVAFQERAKIEAAIEEQAQNDLNVSGLVTKKKNLVFLIETSAVLRNPDHPTAEDDFAIELRVAEQLVALLPVDQGFTFNLVSFAGGMEHPERVFDNWAPEDTYRDSSVRLQTCFDDPAGRLVAVTEETKREASQWIRRLVPGKFERDGCFGSPLIEAIERGCSFETAEAIFVMTSGVDNRIGTWSDERIRGEIDAIESRAKPEGIEVKVVGLGFNMYMFESSLRSLVSLCKPKGDPPGRGSFIGR